MFIYVIVCSENLKLYVGEHVGTNLRKYLQTKLSNAKRSSGVVRSHLFAAMRKHPRESWSIHPLVSEIASKEELDTLERHYIRALKVQHSAVGYNICDGGGGTVGCKHPIEGVRRAVEACRNSPTWRQRQSESKKGKPAPWMNRTFSEDHRANLRTAHKGISWSAARREAQAQRVASGAQAQTNANRSAAYKGRIPWNKGIRSRT